MFSLASCVSLWVMSSSGPGNGWTENKALASCPFSMRVLFDWFNLHLVCGVPGYGKSCSLFWVMRAEVSNKHFWLQSVSSVIWVAGTCCSSAATIPVSRLGVCTPLSAQTAGQPGRNKAVFTDGRAIPEPCLYVLGQTEAPAFSSSFLGVGVGSGLLLFPSYAKTRRGPFFVFLCARLGAHEKWVNYSWEIKFETITIEIDG